MKTKNICQKAFIPVMFAMIIFGGLLAENGNAMSSGVSYAKNSRAVNVSCAATYEKCSSAGNLINYTIVIFLALVIWSVSPVGILFFLASGALISKHSSRIKRTVAWLAQVFAFLAWLSFMMLLSVAYIDSISYNVFNLGGTTLEIAIASGAGFFIVMFVIAHIEKRIEREIISEREANRKNNNIRKNEEEKDDKRDRNGRSIKIAGIEFAGVKDKIRKKIKEDLKEIVDDEIERRL